MIVQLVGYDRFPRDRRALKPEARKALGALLEKLQANPYDPEIQRACEVESGERYSYIFYENYAVYWHVVAYSPVWTVVPSDADAITIQLTGIRRVDA